MQFNSILKNILITRHFLVDDSDNNEKANEKTSYYNAFLLSNFGIVVDKPELLSYSHIKELSDKFKLEVPKSFYDNPQDLRYFTNEELLIEQLVSYFAYGSELGRIELFKKDLPEYVVGDELKLREFYILNEKEAHEQLRDIIKSYCSYTRPFSIEEQAEFMTLYQSGYMRTDDEIKCKDNVFALLDEDVTFARFLDKKDIVKLSIHKFGDKASFDSLSFSSKYYLDEELKKISKYIPFVKHCPLSKKQAKYYNKILSLCNIKASKETNVQSPDRRALKMIAEGNVVGAADIYASSGSMLEIRIKMLLSRANPREAVEILDMIPAKNPIVLFQTINNIIEDSGKARTFTFYHDNKVKTHRETEYETLWRKSKLNEATRELLKATCIEKIKAYYSNLPSLGNIYVADNFNKLGLPTNTSASGKGIDVLPIGSRVPCTGSAIRTFVHWKNAFDIDSSLIIVGLNDEFSVDGWFSYGHRPFGNDILFSGDITGQNGAEYYDINLEALAAKGYKYVVQTFHGYRSNLDTGEIYAGYQNKDNLNTKTWDPKNIEMQFRVKGDSRSCIAFAIDIQTREVIILNQILADDNRVVRPEGFKTIEKYLNNDYLAVNMGQILSCRGNLVDNPLDADIIFDDSFTKPEVLEDALEEIKEYKIIRSWELEKLVAFLNE